MSYDQFKSQYNGQPVDVDKAYGNQCWDLVALYNQKVIGIPASAGWGLPTGPDLDAKDVWLYFNPPLSQYFDKIANDPKDVNQVPQKGDVVVWGFAPDGHIAIFDAVTGAGTFQSFDQNWPIGSFAHIQQHNYNGVLGWLRPKQKPTAGGPMMVDRNLLNNMYMACFGRNPYNNATGVWDDPAAKQYLGSPADVVLQILLDSPERQAYLKAHQPGQATLNKSSIMTYLQEHLQ